MANLYYMTKDKFFGFDKYFAKVKYIAKYSTNKLAYSNWYMYSDSTIVDKFANYLNSNYNE